jgi:hypothetical protein
VIQLNFGEKYTQYPIEITLNSSGLGLGSSNFTIKNLDRGSTTHLLARSSLQSWKYSCPLKTPADHFDHLLIPSRSLSKQADYRADLTGLLNRV